MTRCLSPIRWAFSLAFGGAICFFASAWAQSPLSTALLTDEPDRAALVSDDLRNFRRALALARQSGEDPIRILRREYFEPATPGLRAYAARYGVTPESIADVMRRYPRYYASLASIDEDVATVENRIRAAFRELKRIYPAAVFPPTYFFVGNLGAGGLTRPEGLLVSLELFGATRSRQTAEFTTELPRVQSMQELPHLVAHELIHFQQAVAQGIDAYRAIFGDRQSLLALAIREGSADFLGALISGGTVYAKVHEFGLPRERELWLQFKAEMHNREPGDWMFSRPSRANWPMDLGYFVGYRITESYYTRATDTRRAVREILAVTDYEAFLRQSAYAARFEGQ